MEDPKVDPWGERVRVGVSPMEVVGLALGGLSLGLGLLSAALQAHGAGGSAGQGFLLGAFDWCLILGGAIVALLRIRRPLGQVALGLAVLGGWADVSGFVTSPAGHQGASRPAAIYAPASIPAGVASDAEGANAQGSAPPPMDVNGSLALLPHGVQIVVGVDLAMLRTSSVWSDLAARLATLPSFAAATGQLTSGCAWNPLKDLDDVTVGVVPTADAKTAPLFALVLHGNHVDKLVSCLAAGLDKSSPIPGVPYDGVTLYHQPNDPAHPMAGAALDSRTAIFAGSEAFARKMLDLRTGHATSDANLRADAETQDLLQRVDTSSTVWVIGSLPPAERSQFFRWLAGDALTSVADATSGLYATADLSDGLVLSVNVVCATDAAATTLSDAATQELAQLRASVNSGTSSGTGGGLDSLLQGVTVTHADTTATLAVQWTGDQVSALLYVLFLLTGSPASSP